MIHLIREHARVRIWPALSQVLRLQYAIENLTIEVLWIQIAMQVHDFYCRIDIKNIEEAFSRIGCHVDTCAICVFCVEYTSLVIAHSFGSPLSLVSILL